MDRAQRATGPEQPWSRPIGAAAMFLRGCTARTASPIALIVGTILSVVNHATVITNGDADGGTWLRIAFNYAVPFVVASLGYLSARHVHPRVVTDRTAELRTDMPQDADGDHDR